VEAALFPLIARKQPSTQIPLLSKTSSRNTSGNSFLSTKG
jgi:hypothetical protein